MVKAIIMVLAFIAALVLAPDAASTEFVDLLEGLIVVPMATTRAGVPSGFLIRVPLCFP